MEIDKVVEEGNGDMNIDKVVEEDQEEFNVDNFFKNYKRKKRAERKKFIRKMNRR